MALLVLSLFFLSLSAGLSTDDASKAVPQEELDLSLRSDTCTYQYALLAKDEPISFLENLLKPIALERFLVDILQHQPAVARRSNPNYYGSLLNVDDVETILKHGRKQDNPKKRIKYLQEWKLVKRTLSDGEWWTGVFKPNSTTARVEEAKEAFAKGGFTLIIKEMQGLWSSVHHVAWLLEAALGWRINVNLYMSPAGSQVPLLPSPCSPHHLAKGFEAHYDWMDGLILQLFGKKNWTIYDPPMAIYPRPDHVKRPTPDFLRFAKQEPDPASPAGSDGDSAYRNLPPQEFVLSAGDLVYVPRGVVHEATASVPSADDEGDLSLHLTFGIETATHYSVEIFLHHFIASRDADTMSLSPPAPVSPPLSSASPSSGNLSFNLESDERTSALSLAESEGALEDFLHLLLSGVASYGPPLLRGAMGVTVMMLDIPQLNPLRTFPSAVREMMGSLHLPTVLKFLIQRGFVKLSVGSSGLTLYPGLDPAHGLYQSADFSCRYLDTFLSQSFLLSPDPRLVTLSLAERMDGQAWLDLLVQEQTSEGTEKEGPSLRYYNRSTAVQLIDSLGNWTAAEGQLIGVLHHVFESQANSSPQGEDEIFCGAWKQMMLSVREEKSGRKKRQVAALKASGQKLS